MAPAEVGLGRGQRLPAAGEADAVLDPGGVRLARRELALQLAVEEQAPIGVEGEELPGAEPRAPHGHAVGERDRARLRRNGDEPVVAHGDPQRPEAVSVERRAARDPVREDEPGGTVPGLGEHRVVAVHRTLPVVDPRVVLPGRRDEERDRLSHVETRADEELERVVEERRVGARAVEGGSEVGVEATCALAGLHPGDVPVDRVDLAVVTEQPERLRALPARIGVGGEPLVEDRPRRRPAGIGEVGVEAPQLRRRAEGLVRHGAERERRHVDALDALGAAPGAMGALLGVRLDARREHELRDPGHGRGRGRPQRGHVRRHVAPAERLEPLGAACLLDDAPEPRLAEEAHREPCALDPGQRGIEREEHPRAVARDAVCRPRAAVRHRREPGERPVDELARCAPARIGDEADAAGVSLDGRVVEWLAHEGLAAFRGSRRKGSLPPGYRLLAGGGGRSPASAVWRR